MIQEFKFRASRAVAILMMLLAVANFIVGCMYDGANAGTSRFAFFLAFVMASFGVYIYYIARRW